MNICRFFMLTFIVVILHVIINTWLVHVGRVDIIGENNDDQLRRLDEIVYSKGEKRILYFSDSVDFYSSPKDDDKSPISHYINRTLETKNFCSIAHKAYHAGVYRAFVEYLSVNKNNLDLIIIPINMRSFSTYWIENPSWQFSELRRYLTSHTDLSKYYYNAAKAFKFYNNSHINKTDYERIEIYFEGNKGGRLKEYFGEGFNNPTADNINKKVKLYYAETVIPQNKRLIDLVQIAIKAKQNAIPILFYITPLDIAACELYGGESVASRIRSNVKFVIDTLKTHDATINDWAFDFSTDLFYYGEVYPNEHLNEDGRKLLADLIVGQVEKYNEDNKIPQANLAQTLNNFQTVQ